MIALARVHRTAVATILGVVACKADGDATTETGTSSTTTMSTDQTSATQTTTTASTDPDSSTDASATTSATETTSSGPSADTTGSDTGTTETALVRNAGFEADDVADGGLLYPGPPAEWQVYDPGSVLNGDLNGVGVLNPMGQTYPDGAPQGDGIALVFLATLPNAGIAAGLSQQLEIELTADTEYVLSVDVGNIATPADERYDFDGFPGYRIELVAGGQVLVADDNTLLPPEGEFLRSEIAYVADGSEPSLGAPLVIRLINLSGPEGIEVNFDDVELVVATAR